MAQRPRLHQIKRTDVNYHTFYEQFQELEREAIHFRKPVETTGELPQTDNRNGDVCLVLGENVIYRWKEFLQNWVPIIGKGYDVPSGSIKRYKGKYAADGGETTLSLPYAYDVGLNVLDVYIQGILQDEGIDYYEVDERTIEFATPLEKGMQITYITPYVVGETRNVTDLQKRLETIEYNHYKLMLTQYYSGKPVQAQGLAFDGFLTTNQIDYLNSTSNIEYLNVDKTIRLRLNTVSKFQETYDTTNYRDPITTVWQRASEITLPLKASLELVFQDGFEDKSKINEGGSSAFVDLVKELVTTDDTYSGGDHYYKGDFMGTTGNADRSATYNYGSTLPNCYSVIAQGNIVTIVNATNVLYRDTYPYNNANYHYTRGAGSYGDNDNLNEIYYFGEAENRYFNVYVKSTNRLYTLKQDFIGSGKYRQELFYCTGRSQDLGTFYGPGWPSGMPATTGYNLATDYIDQMGSDADHVLLRIDNRIYFIKASTWTVVRVLDFTGSVRKPSLYVQNSKQFTADGRYLYFPARLYRDSLWGYYLEVFDKQTGEFVNEILVTRDNSGQPTTTAMHYDQWNNRMILGLWGNNWYNLAGKNWTSYNNTTSIAGFYALEVPSTSFKVLQSKSFATNLPSVQYKLETSQVLNGGVIDYYIRFGQNPWEKINAGTTYTWDNPLGAKETTIELRAMLRTTIGVTKAPELTEWKLSVKTYQTSGIYQSKEQVMDLQHVTGGRLFTDKTVPNETSLQWYVKLDTDDPYIEIGENGTFSTPNEMDTARVTLRSLMATNNPLMSPVVRDATLHLHFVDAGTLVSNNYEQLEDIKEATMWVTTGTSSEYYTAFLSRDGGLNWVEGTKEDSLQMQDGTAESKFHFVFNGNEQERQKLKVKFEITGSTEFHQYGIMINPS